MRGGLFAVLMFFSSLGCLPRQSPENAWSGLAGPDGAVFESRQFQVSIGIPEGAYTEKRPVRMQIAKTQFPGLAVPGYVISPLGISLDLDTEFLVYGSSLEVRIPFSEPEYDSERTFLVAENETGVPVFLEERKEKGFLVGDFSTRMIHFLDSGDIGREKLIFYYVVRHPGRLPDASVATRVKTWSDGNWINSLPPPLDGKRVAILVHDIAEDAISMKALAGFLSRISPAVYEYVVAFEYDSTSSLSTIGDTMAKTFYPLLPKAREVDVFAHGVGCLVSRRAMTGAQEVPGLAPVVSRFVGMGGPENGLPFGSVTSFEWMVYWFMRSGSGEGIASPLLDICTDGIDGIPVTDFMKDLNYSTVRPIPVLTLSGERYNTYRPGGRPVGLFFQALYNRTFRWNPPAQDGMVSKDSAHGELAMGRWAAPWTKLHFAKDHDELRSDPEVLAEISSWLADSSSLSREGRTP